MAIDGLRVPDGRNSITRLIYGNDELFSRWVAIQLKQPLDYAWPCRAIGIVKESAIIGGVVYNNYHEDCNGRPLVIEMTISSIDKTWCSRHNLNQLFAYPFIQLNVKRVQATCSRKAKHVREFLERLGFRFEGIMREASPFGGDLAHYSMLKPECKWIASEALPQTTRSARSSSHIGSTNKIKPRNSAL